MTQTPPKEPRRTLWSHGRRGDADWIRVLVDEKQMRVEVKYRDGRGSPRKKIYPNDRIGRNQAVQWAEAYRDDRHHRARQTDTTHRQLWRAYIDSLAWQNLRETSKPSYIERWAKWEHARGATARVNDTSLLHVEAYIKKARAQGGSINQIRQVINVARLVYNWGQSRKLIQENCFVGWRWVTPKDAGPIEPEEFTPEEAPRILAQLPPQSSRAWRAHVAVMIAAHHGARVRAILHLTWAVLAGDDIVWPKELQKNGRPLRQPLTWDLIAAFQTARHWHTRLGYTGPYILCGGTTATRGETRALREWEKDPKHKRVGTGQGKARAIGDKPYSYSGLMERVHEAERAAGITPKKYRGMHGFRKLAAGNVAEQTGDTRLAMEWIGDDIRQAPKYLKRREDRMQRAADAAGQLPNASRTTVPELSPESQAAKTPSDEGAGDA